MLFKTTKPLFAHLMVTLIFFDILTVVFYRDTLASNLTRLRNVNINKSNERKQFHTKKTKRKPYYSKTIIHADYGDDLALIAKTPAAAEFLLHS